ncbi:MAG: dehydrogenase, partial [Chloroflexi bacterium]|nr:dehydrogenase [Chloroflexota bacterium]
LGAREGIPTFCEKPISLDLATTDRVLAVVAKSGITLQIGFQRRFDSGFAEVRRLVESGVLGRIYAARLATHDPAPPPGAYLKTSGGLYADLMIHDFDILRWTTGLDIASVYATGATLTGDPAFEEAGDVDTAAVIATLEGGATAVITGLRHNPRGYDVRLELFGSKDSIVTGMDSRAPIRSVGSDTGSNASTERAEKPEYTDFLDRFGDAYRAEMKTFISVARGEMENLATGDDAREALRAAEAAALSAREGRVVEMSEIR